MQEPFNSADPDDRTTPLNGPARPVNRRPPGGRPSGPIVLPRRAPLVLTTIQPAPEAVRPLTLQQRAQAAATLAPEWVRWHYSEAEWQQWVATEWQRLWNPIRWIIAICISSIVMVVVCNSILLATGHTPLQSLSSITEPWYMLIIGGLAYWGLWWTPLFTIAMLITQPSRYQQARQWRTLHERGPRMVSIGPTVVWDAGQETPLLTDRWELGAAWLIRKQSPQTLLVLRLEEPRQRTPLYHLSLPVPAGHEAEAEQLVMQLRALLSGAPLATPTTGRATVHLPPLASVLPEQGTQHLGGY